MIPSLLFSHVLLGSPCAPVTLSAWVGSGLAEATFFLSLHKRFCFGFSHIHSVILQMMAEGSE